MGGLSEVRSSAVKNEGFDLNVCAVGVKELDRSVCAVGVCSTCFRQGVGTEQPC